ncbi:MAG: hypothetical protein OER91_03420 [Gammaproteobacteria bacterium]|nr:hypothetical protein [Gammaproteobacteria bacterium]
MRLLLALLFACASACAFAQDTANCTAESAANAFAICLACHTAAPGAGPMSGPNLWGIMGRKAGTDPGYDYSEAISGSGITWNNATMSRYLANPSGYLPGTRMIAAPVRDESDIAAILCHLNSLTATAAVTAVETSVPYTGARFRRWSPIVSDLDATIHLYTEILGFELGDVSIDPPTSYVYEVFGISPDVRTRHATFHAGEDKRVLSVVEVPGARLVRAGGSPRMSAALFNANGRFDEIVARLTAEGFEMMSPHKLGEQGIEIGFIDRDGHLYALYEYPYDGQHQFETEE